MVVRRRIVAPPARQLMSSARSESRPRGRVALGARTREPLFRGHLLRVRRARVRECRVPWSAGLELGDVARDAVAASRARATPPSVSARVGRRQCGAAGGGAAPRLRVAARGGRGREVALTSSERRCAAAREVAARALGDEPRELDDDRPAALAASVRRGQSVPGATPASAASSPSARAAPRAAAAATARLTRAERAGRDAARSGPRARDDAHGARPSSSARPKAASGASHGGPGASSSTSSPSGAGA